MIIIIRSIILFLFLFSIVSTVTANNDIIVQNNAEIIIDNEKNDKPIIEQYNTLIILDKLIYSMITRSDF